MKICVKCGIKFEAKNPKTTYCSRTCYNNAKAMRRYNRWRKNSEKLVCKKCGCEYAPTRENQIYCSYGCSGAARTKFLSIPDCLELASRKLDKKIGYVRVYCPMHPKANTWGYVYEHRLIMESIIGRHLTDEEHIHHINGKRWDNSPDNLQIMSPSEHSKLKKLIKEIMCQKHK